MCGFKIFFLFNLLRFWVEILNEYVKLECNIIEGVFIIFLSVFMFYFVFCNIFYNLKCVVWLFFFC